MSDTLSVSVLVVGPFPPPVHGASLATAAFAIELEQCGLHVQRINLAAKSLDRSGFRRFQRIPRIVSGLVSATLRLRKNPVLYVSLAGGHGQVYDILFLTLGRVAGSRIVLHHHSYAYLNRQSRLTKVLLQTAGTHCSHIVLCDDMREKLETYGVQRSSISTISNAFAVAPDSRSAVVPKRFLRTIGFLSNISEPKGIFDFLATLKALTASENVTGLIAGRFEDAQIESQVRKTLESQPAACYVGPLDDTGKAEFFSRIDVLVFPTKYVNEAEPLILHEAMAKGVPVIARARGCIGTLISPDVGLAVNPGEDFVQNAVRHIRDWIESPVTYEAASKAARIKFDRLRERTGESLRESIGTTFGGTTFGAGETGRRLRHL